MFLANQVAYQEVSRALYCPYRETMKAAHTPSNLLLILYVWSKRICQFWDGPPEIKLVCKTLVYDKNSKWMNQQKFRVKSVILTSLTYNSNLRLMLEQLPSNNYIMDRRCSGILIIRNPDICLTFPHFHPIWYHDFDFWYLC